MHPAPKFRLPLWTSPPLTPPPPGQPASPLPAPMLSAASLTAPRTPLPQNTQTLFQAGPLRRQPCPPHGAPPSSLPPALSQAPGPPEPLTSVFPLLWQERRVSSLEAHSVACGRSTQTSHGCAAHCRGRQQAGLGEDQSWERVNDSQWG